jgi:hypothetical protein
MTSSASLRPSAISASVVEKSSNSRVLLSLPLHTITSTPAGSCAISRANLAWMEMRRASSIASTGRRVGTGEYSGGPHSRTTILVAPQSMARRTGTLSTTAPSMNRSPSMSIGGKMVGMAEDARIASTAGP